MCMMGGRQTLTATSIRLRRALLCGLIPLCLFVAGYCIVAGLASGGWHANRDGEPSYSSPVHHAQEFYTALRWSVTIVGAVMAITAYLWKHRRVSAVFSISAVLFNPIVPVHVQKGTWEFFDLLAFWVFLIGPGYLWPDSANADTGLGA
jgi:hypothetical protein